MRCCIRSSSPPATSSGSCWTTTRSSTTSPSLPPSSRSTWTGHGSVSSRHKRRLPRTTFSRAVNTRQRLAVLSCLLQSSGLDSWAVAFIVGQGCLESLLSLSNETSASTARYQHCRKWMFWVRNLHPERAIYGNVDITLWRHLPQLN